MKTSPGPWRWENDTTTRLMGPRVKNEHGGESSGEVLWYYPIDGDCENPADRALIASAPEMLELLRDLEWRQEHTGCTFCGAIEPGNSYDP